MDLGFGAQNQVVGDAMAKVMRQGARVQEELIDQELEKYDALLEDDEALEALREKRLAALKQQQSQLAKWKDLGHGTYQEFGASVDKAKAFFEAAKRSSQLVVHFYRPTTRYCDIFHAMLDKLARKHLETRFVKLNVEEAEQDTGNGVSYLTQKLGIQVMPTLLLVKNRKAVHHIRGFDEIPGGADQTDDRVLAHVLSRHGLLTLKPDEEDFEDELEDLLEQARKGVNGIHLTTKQSLRSGYDNETAQDELQ